MFFTAVFTQVFIKYPTRVVTLGFLAIAIIIVNTKLGIFVGAGPSFLSGISRIFCLVAPPLSVLTPALCGRMLGMIPAMPIQLVSIQPGTHSGVP